MTTPSNNGNARPAGFSSPLGQGRGGTLGRTAADMASLARDSKAVADNMERAAKASERVSRSGKGGLGPLGFNAVRSLGAGNPATGGSSNGGGARFSGVPTTGAAAILPVGAPGRVFGAQYAQAARATAAGPPAALNGGGANIPALPGTWTSPPAGMGTGQLSEYRPVSNGGGARFAGRAAAGVGLSGVAAAAGVAANPDTFRDIDFLSNRMARSTSGGYNHEAATRRIVPLFGGGFSSNAQASELGRTLLNRSGFDVGSHQFFSQARSAAGIGARNPLLAGGAAANVQNSLNAGPLYNSLAVTQGIHTVGRGGAPMSIEDVAHQFADRTRGTRNGVIPLPQVRANFQEGNGGILFQLQQSGASPDLIQAIQDVLEEESTLGRRLRPGESAGSARNLPGSSSMLGSEQRTARGTTRLTASLTTEYSQGYAGSLRLIEESTNSAAAALERMEAAADAIGKAAGFAGGLGSNPVTGAMLGTAGAAAGGALLGGSVRGVARALGRGGRLGGVLGRASLGGLAMAGGIATGAAAGLGALYYGFQGIQGARAEGDMSLGNMWQEGFGGRVLGYRGGNETGDGIGQRNRGSQVQVNAATGGTSMHYAPETGDGPGSGRGGQTYQYLKQLMKSSGIPHRITSEVRPNARTTSGNTSFHATGHAIDIAGPKPGKDTPEMLRINRFLAQKLGKGARELIYSGPGGINLYNGSPHNYSGRVKALHHDHVHVAVTNETLKRIGEKVDLSQTAAEAMVERNAGRDGAQVRRAQEKERELGRGRRTLPPRQGRNGFSMKNLIEDFFGGVGSGGRRTTRDDGPDPSEGQAQQAANGGEKGQSTAAAGSSVGGHAIDKFLAGLRQHESGNDYRAENPTSTASGAYQYLTGTWNRYAGFSTAGQAPPAIQDRRAREDASRLYQKYGNWRLVAAAHFRGEGWLRKNMDPSTWGNDRTGGATVPNYVRSVLSHGGLPETGDGIGDGPASAAPVTAQVPDVQHRAPGGGGGRQSLNVRSSGGVQVGKVEVHIHTNGKVSEAEAQRIGKMVVKQIADQAKMMEMSR